MLRVLALAVVTVTLGACGQGEPKPRACLAPTPAQAAPSTVGMVFIKGGTFQMGAAPMRPEEGPPRPTKVGAFWIDRTEVSNGDFARFVATTGYVTLAERPLDPKAYPGLSGDDLKPSGIVFAGEKPTVLNDPRQWWRAVQGANWRHPEGPRSSIQGKDAWPVVQIGWNDAMAYAKWLGRDLPTEAEWEYAAQGRKAATRYVWGDKPLDDAKPQANVWQGAFPGYDSGGDGYRARAAPVGCFPANGFGLHDMAGNVWEWAKDVYRLGLDPVGDTVMFEPGDPGARSHVIKGGSFLCSPNYCYRYRPAAREPGPTDTGENHIGFRTVLRVKPSM